MICHFSLFTFFSSSLFAFSHSLSVPFRAEGEIKVEESPVEAFAHANSDGKLDFQEFLHTDALFEALKGDEFSQLDANSDGRVSREEYYPSGGWYQGYWRGGQQKDEQPPALHGGGGTTEGLTGRVTGRSGDFIHFGGPNVASQIVREKTKIEKRAQRKIEKLA